MATDTIVADLYSRVLDGIAQEIVDANLLPDLDNRVFTQFEENSRNVLYPCVFVTLNTEPEEDGDATGCEAIDLIYSGQLLVAGRDSTDDATKIETYTGYRQTLIRHFEDISTLPGVPECWDVSAKMTVVLDQSNPIYQQIKTGLTVRARCTVPRRTDL